MLTRDIIGFLKTAINGDNYVSLSVVGSEPKELLPGKDLDVIFVIERDKIRDFFEDLTRKFDEFIDESVDYSFFRGPIKLKDKGLIHFLVYANDFESDGAGLGSEPVSILKIFSKDSRTVNGKSFASLLKGFDWNKKDVWMEKMKKKYEVLKNKNYIEFPEWKKLNGSWCLVRSGKKPSKFLRNYLLDYYEGKLR